MRKILPFIICISLFFPVLSVISLAEDYPVISYAAYWRWTSDGVNFQTINVTPQTTRSGLSFAFPQDSGYVTRLQLYILAYSGAPSYDNNVTGIQSISGTVFFTETIGYTDVSIQVDNQYYNGSWIVNGSSSLTPGSSFFIQPSNGMSGRFLALISRAGGAQMYTNAKLTVAFSDLVINDKTVTSDQFISGKIDDLTGKVDKIDADLSGMIDYQSSGGSSETAGSQQLLDLIGSDVSSIESSISDHKPHAKNWLDTSTVSGDLIAISALSTQWLTAFIHCDPDVTFFWSLVTFAILFTLIESGLRRRPWSGFDKDSSWESDVTYTTTFYRRGREITSTRRTVSSGTRRRI